MKIIQLNTRYIYLLFFLALFQATQALAQQDRRTIQTRVADVLAKFPASDSTQYKSLMKELADLGEPGILNMAALINPAGQGDNTKVFYALNGLSFYANSGKNENLRKTTSVAYSKALSQVADINAKSFLISQIQIVGKEEAVPALVAYLSNEELCGYAARALTKINSPSANQALVEGVASTKGTCQYALIGALGETRYAPALSHLEKLAGSNEDHRLQRLALNAVANIGNPASEGLLVREAQKADYQLSDNNATAAFLLWSKRMVETGNSRPVERRSLDIIKSLNKDEQVHTKTALMHMYVNLKGKDANSFLLNAANDKNKEYRAEVLRAALKQTSEQISQQWVNQLRKANAEVKADIIGMLSERNDPVARQAILQHLNNENQDVKISAINALPKIGGEGLADKLLEMIKTAAPEEAEAIRGSLLTMKSNNLNSKVAETMALATPHGQAALIDILGRRKATEHGLLVMKNANSENPMIRSAAINALQEISSRETLPELYILLSNTHTEEEANAIQAAINNALVGEDELKSTDEILEQMQKASPDKKHYYYGVLAAIGSKRALDAVLLEYAQGELPEKKAAIDALSNWTNFSAGRELLKIAQHSAGEPYFEQALLAYVNQVRKSNETEKNKYLLLREALDIAQTPGQRRKVIQEIGRNSKTFPALMYVGRFLDNQEVQAEAANAVMNIASTNPDFYGPEVRGMLKTVINKLEGQESAYLKEALQKHLDELPKDTGFVPLFNGQDLSGWKGLVGDPVKRSQMKPKKLEKEQRKADEAMRQSWKVVNGTLVFTGNGDNISTIKKYGDFEMYVDWKIEPDGDAGVYLRGTPQVQIWDPAREDVGAEVGSGGLYNNKDHESKPLKVADNPVGEWNNFRIIMEGEQVTVYLNGHKVVDHVVLENYWQPGQPIFDKEHIELQAHGTRVAYRDIYIREMSGPEPLQLTESEQKDGFKMLFDGTSLENFIGDKESYVIENGILVIHDNKKGNLFTKDQYADFQFRFEFQLTPGANNGVAIRAPAEGDAAYAGMEIQILDNTADIYKDLEPYQYHGSVYGIIPAERGYLKPVGEWNEQEIRVQGSKIKVTLNGNVILDGDLEEATKNGAMDGKDHPGLKRNKGHIGFLGHDSEVRFRNVRVKDLGNGLSRK